MIHFIYIYILLFYIYLYLIPSTHECSLSIIVCAAHSPVSLVCNVHETAPSSVCRLTDSASAALLGH